MALLAYTGMRLGEGLALQWSQVHLQERVIEIERSVTWTRSQGWVEKEPKNGCRKVGICPQLHEVLTRHRAQIMAQHQLPVGRVCQASSGNYLQATRVRSRLKAAAQALDLGQKVTPQVLRRTWNTLGLTTLDRVLVQAQIGHADDQMSAHYLGLKAEQLCESATRMWG